MKYNLSFWQRLCLPLIWCFWVAYPLNKRKSWHEVKKGMEHHTHEFEEAAYEIYRDEFTTVEYRKCKHEGCNMVGSKRIRTQRGIDFDNSLGWQRDEKGYLITT